MNSDNNFIISRELASYQRKYKIEKMIALLINLIQINSFVMKHTEKKTTRNCFHFRHKSSTVFLEKLNAKQCLGEVCIFTY